MKWTINNDAIWYDDVCLYYEPVPGFNEKCIHPEHSNTQSLHMAGIIHRRGMCTEELCPVRLIDSEEMYDF